MSRLRTNVSIPYWCRPSSGSYEFEEASVHKDDTEKWGWMDRLLHGGIVLPGRNRAVTILVTGPPGTGKSTLAIELAGRWTHAAAWPSGVLSATPHPRVLYVTTEAPADWLISNAATFDWHFEFQSISALSEQQLLHPGRINVMHLEPVELLEAIKPESFASLFLGIFRPRSPSEVRVDFNVEALIIDSLNTFGTPEEKSSIFAALSRLASSGPRVIVMVLDSPPVPQTRDAWEFASDIVLRLDRSYEHPGHDSYLVRTIELVKARYQTHVLGKHQLKIQEGMENKFKTMNSYERMRAHPYRKEGGVFIFPSIHYTLSLYKRSSPTEKDKEYVDLSHVKNLDRLLGHGYPKGRCTALLGQRGGHKSHLAYREILGRIAETFHGPKRKKAPGGISKALIVSLRDDEGMVRQTLQGILTCTEFRGQQNAEKNAKQRLKEYEKADVLEIAYYPPGYITPEEFFHRLILSIQRLKSDGAHVTLLFNSLDQLSSRFPLCAHEPIFIPGIISTLTAEQVSSFFVTATSLDGPGRESYGLETMAELILNFERKPLQWQQYQAYLTGAFGQDVVERWPGRPVSTEWERQAVTVSVARYAGGQAAGAEGVLELIDDTHWLNNLCTDRDLYFLPPIR